MKKRPLSFSLNNSELKSTRKELTKTRNNMVRILTLTEPSPVVIGISAK
jgi:hypothetical protein